MLLFSVFNQAVRYGLAETLCCRELTQHKVTLSRALPLPFQICQVTARPPPAAASLAVFPLGFYFPEGDHFNQP